MASSEIRIRTRAGSFAAIDYGGSGPACLLIHGTGQNALAWRELATVLDRRHRVIGFDLRGHGQTLESSRDAEQYWRDIGSIMGSLGLTQPILIGHSTGAYAAMAHAAATGNARAVICVDGFTLDAPPPADREPPEWATTARSLFERFHYGWRATRAERDAYIDETVAAAPGDALNAGVDAELLRSMLERCFVETDGLWLRRPTLEEIEIVGTPPRDAAIGPYRTIYDQIATPLLLVWAERGLSAARRQEVEAVAGAGANRAFVAVDAGHNVPLERPVELARIIERYLD